MFNIFGKRMQGDILKPEGHAVYVFRDALGRLRIMDRCGRSGRLGKVFDSLDLCALAGVNRLEHEAVAQAFEVHKVIMRQGKKALEQQAYKYHVLTPGDWMSRIAQKFHGDRHKWPLIYEANRDVIGVDPNLIKPGQRRLIPALAKVGGIRQ
ncbi:MAG: hypothetical protein PHR30_13095 [Gallionellaceae bacterium]|nr:hypothetical protein [Gallionellaceae bacterium]